MDDEFIILPESGRSIDELLEWAAESLQQGMISQSRHDKLVGKLEEARAHFVKVMAAAIEYLDDSERKYEARKLREEAERRRAADEAKRREEEERRRRKEEEARQREEEERRRKEEEERAQREEEERRRREEEERTRREEEERLRKEEEMRKLEPPLSISELESLDWRIKTLDLGSGAMSLINMYWEALSHGDWETTVESILKEREQSHLFLEPLPFTWTRILREPGLLIHWDNICPRDETNPLMVPGFLYAPLYGSDDHVLVIVNKQSRRGYRYSRDSIVRISGSGLFRKFSRFDGRR